MYSNTLEAAYLHCEALAKNHYENFPVASRFLPKALRRPIAVIYAFARQADDMADEGDLSNAERLNALTFYERALSDIAEHQKVPDDPVFIALNDVLNKHPLPIALFFDLLRAFKQDVIKNEYENFDEILAYCQNSANPIGRLLLHLTHNATETNLTYSDAVCTALQLINFLQDLSSDVKERNRCYLPKNEMDDLNITIQALAADTENADIQKLIYTQLERTEKLLQTGKKLGKKLKGLFGFEIRIIINAGNEILCALKRRKSVYERPTLKCWHWPKLVWRSL